MSDPSPDQGTADAPRAPAAGAAGAADAAGAGPPPPVPAGVAEAPRPAAVRDPRLLPPLPTDACANCGAPLAAAYCGDCGQRRVTGRLAVGEVLRDLGSRLIDVESGLFFTVWTSMTRPDRVVVDWLCGRRRPYTSPLRFAFVVFSVVVAANTWLLGAAPMDERSREGLRQMQDWFGSAGAAGAGLSETMARVQWVFLALLLPLLAVCTWTCFRPWRRTFAEHLAGAAYVYSAWGALSLALMAFEAWIGTRTWFVPNPITNVASFLWIPWAVARTFPGADTTDRVGRAVGAWILAIVGITVLTCTTTMIVAVYLLVHGRTGR